MEFVQNALVEQIKCPIKISSHHRTAVNVDTT